MRRRLFLIDSFGFIFRAYHARARSGAPPMRTATGLPTEAVFIFHNMLKKLISTQKPELLAAIFESEGPTFREQEFEAYKANRAPMPEDLGPQIPYVRKLLEAMKIPVLDFAGFEADDVIGTLSVRALADDLDVVIVSSDKDMLQLVNNRVIMLNPMKPDPPADFTLYDPPKVLEFMGVPPEHVADLLALKGDAVDNIPGAPGIGDKGAKDLVTRFGSVESILDHAAEVERKMYRESLIANRDQVLLSKKLATINCSVPVEWDLEAAHLTPPDAPALREIYRELEMYTALKELDKELGIEPAALVQPLEFREAASLTDLSAPLAWVPAPAMLAATAGASMREGEGIRVLGDGPLPEGTLYVHDLKALPPEADRRETLDVMLAGFLVLADPSDVTLDRLSERYLQRKPGPTPEERAEAVFALGRRLEAELEPLGLRALYDEVDRPLVSVLRRMEQTGILVDKAQLGTMAAKMLGEIERLTAEIYQSAGHEFNINSPQQLGKVLFDELGLQPGGRTRTKQQSTAADVLEGLAEEGHAIAQQTLEYRQLTKLKSTYVDALPTMISAGSGRVHTTFNQCGAATGRLSSGNPNLQNIPIRTELGREIRAAFVPEPGWQLVVADYSQIELRLLAHMSRDKVLMEAFINGEDIHTRTAAEVFGVPPMMVTPEMRRNAKAVNFGIVYGQTAFGLASQIGVSRAEADTYIRSYFSRYSGVRKWLDATIAQTRRDGYVSTLHGRRRPIPDIQSRNPNARGFAERTAVNTPLQGTAADLIKVAMIRIDRLLREEGWQSRLLLQVHDELVLEAPADEAPRLAKMVKREMESVYKLAVPLIVDTGTGTNWRDAK